ncbi:uncharacterized protein METZ01_LOCUS249461, partial [marine metagenome]
MLEIIERIKKNTGAVTATLTLPFEQRQ